ncbi:MAG TPA: hypothetical protein VF334_06245 [Polyangia bacterium]
MALPRLALRTILCATTMLCFVGSAVADEPPPQQQLAPPAQVAQPASGSEVSPALIGLAPGAESPQPASKHRKLWIALGVVSGVAVVGALIAVGVTVGTSSSHNDSVFHDWGTLTVTRR